jgi:hypothetical protein
MLWASVSRAQTAADTILRRLTEQWSSLYTTFRPDTGQKDTLQLNMLIRHHVPQSFDPYSARMQYNDARAA